ncbi:regulatory protein YycH of two-component signal transduction system YycFG [Pullulanibacillus pueri]|uniref:Transcriptional regulator n=1 Tax=Pullulanibacillus pueri TaxID=1437324 RepID=A0A8J2ZV10_9BACL|nr:two-component system activity regulator YycH [Pullulanibacillus pueri]MBM7682194.1 regulatory protein YycH of two-component signal transduction system YycFG [Pullulanibacillus pueri]GGH80398.1 transcriptional regulator [Pullulanibacillus pueri]
MRETFKTILLTVLVLLSMFFTWNIWTFQGDFKEEPKTSVQSASIAKTSKSYNLNDVVKPYQFIIHTNHRLYGNVDSDVIDRMFSTILAARWTLPVNTNFDESHLNKEYELVFSAPITAELIQSLFKFSNDNVSLPNNLMIYKIALILESDETNNASKTATIVFKDATGKGVFYATSKNFNVSKIESLGNEKDLGEIWSEYMAQEVKNGKKIYLPEKAMTNMTPKTFIYKPVQIERFEQILFPDLSQVTPNGSGVYTDGENMLSSDQDVLTFKSYNGSSSASQDMDTIYESWAKVNSLGGWTDHYIYDDYIVKPTNGESDVSFRMMIDNLPVYSPTNAYQTMVYMKWNKGQLTEFNRTLLDLNSVRLYEGDNVHLYSGQEALAILKENGENLKDIQDIRVGYILYKNQDQQSVTLTPSWLYKKDDQWNELISQSDAERNAQLKNKNVNNQLGGSGQ